MLLISLVLGLNVAEAVPTKLAQQGRLLDSNGMAVTGIHALTFRVYDDETAGNILWQEVLVEDFIGGYYSVVLGADSLNPLDDSILSQYPLYLEMAVDNAAPLSPRKEFGSAPYARVAGIAEQVDGGSVNASQISVNGALVIDGSGSWVGPVMSLNWADINNIPSDIADGDDDTLAGITCNSGEILGWNGSAWGCVADNGLTEAEVEAYIENDPINLSFGSTMGGDEIVTTATLGNTLDNTSCGQGEILSYDQVSGWACTNFTQMLDNDADGILSWNDCDDNDPSLLGTSMDADCDGAITALDCDDNDPNSNTMNNDYDCDGYVTLSDCDDSNPNMPGNDIDCDGVSSADDCDDFDPAVLGFNLDADCDGTPTAQDCDDNDPNSNTQANDADCDGLTTGSDCNDNNADMPANDADCDGALTSEDCDDNDTNVGSQANDNDCDGVLAGLDCNDNDPAITSTSNCQFEFASSQTISGQTVTCSSVTNTGAYTQCNDMQVNGQYMPNGVTCGPTWSTGQSYNQGDLCTYLTGGTTFEAYYICQNSPYPDRVGWDANNDTWQLSLNNDNGYTQHLKCFY